MKTQFNKNIALEDSHNREVVAGCYGRGGCLQRDIYLKKGGLKSARDSKKTGCPEGGILRLGIPITDSPGHEITHPCKGGYHDQNYNNIK